MNRNLTLNELIADLQKYQAEHGDKEIVSIGTGSGSDGCYKVYTKENSFDTPIQSKIWRE
jgi:hypothetical protein